MGRRIDQVVESVEKRGKLPTATPLKPFALEERPTIL